MRYADRDGNIYEEENGQDRLLNWMYTTMAGRASLKILIRPTNLIMNSSQERSKKENVHFRKTKIS